MKLRSLVFGLVGLGVAAAAVIVPAVANTWVSLGRQTVGKRADFDSLIVGKSEGRYEALRFRVTGNRVAFGEVRVHFGDGSQQVLPVKEHVNPGETTRAYDLDGKHRFISRIDMLYQSEFRFLGAAQVEVFGLNYTGGPGPGPNAVNLGTHPVNTVIDRDTFPVGVSKGPFRALRFHVSGRPIHVTDVRVTFGNGQTQQYNFNYNFSAGANSPLLDLAGDRRLIRSVTIVYRTITPGPGQSRLTMWAYR